MSQRPSDSQFRAAARRILEATQGRGLNLEPDHHGEVQHPHGDYAFVSVWLRVEAKDAMEELP